MEELKLLEDKGYTAKDCPNDNDGHADKDNTYWDHVSDTDGDIERIGSTNYPYAIRAIAGLIYYFAKETGQIDNLIKETFTLRFAHF